MRAEWENLFIQVYRKRGLDYYREGRVTDLIMTGPGSWQAHVMGTRSYLVTVDLPGKGAKPLLTCSCPVARDGYRCKHMAAVLYAVDREADPEPPAPSAPAKISADRVPLFAPGSVPKAEPGAGTGADSYLNTVPFYDFRRTLAPVTVPADYSREADSLIASGRAFGSSGMGMPQPDADGTLRAAVYFVLSLKTSVFPVIAELRHGSVPYLECRSGLRRYPCARPDPEKGVLCPHCIAALRLLADRIASPDIPERFSDSIGESLVTHFSRALRSAPSRQVGSLPITVSPVLDASTYSSPALLFRVGSKKLLQCRDLCALADAFHSGGIYPLSDREALDFSLQGVEEASRPFLDFLIKWTDNDRALSSVNPTLLTAKRDSMLLPLYGERLDEFFDLCRGTPLPLRSSVKRSVRLEEEEVLPRVVLTPVYEDGFLRCVRGEGTRPPYIVGSRYAYVLDRTRPALLRMDLKPVREWEKLLPGLKYNFSFTVGREALPEFYRHVVPFLREHALVSEEKEEAVSAWLPPEGEISFYLDAEDDRITCTVSAAYGDREWKLYDPDQKIEPWRDRVLEDGALDAALDLFPGIDREHALLYRARDDDFVCTLLAEGTASLEKWGRVMASDRFGSIRVRRRLSVRAGVRLENDLLTLEVTCGDLSEKELKEILDACVMKKRWHRLRSGDYVDLESESLEELRQLMEAAHVGVRDLVRGKMDIPAYRALYLDTVLREHGEIQASRDTAFRQLVRTFRTVSESDIEVPPVLRDVLRPYQVTGFQWLTTLALAGFGGILADDMGLGKTVQMICALLWRRDHPPESGHAPSLIVCPASLVYNWQAEFERFAPDMKVLPVTGTAAQRRDLIASAASWDVLVTSYDLLKRDVDLYADILFDCHVLDEAQYVKTASSVAARSVKAVRSAHRFALTGTPIENSLSELWSIFDFLMPGFLYEYGYFRSHIEAPAVKDASSEAMTRLKKMTAPFLLRRLKKDVLRDLPDKLEEVRTVVLSRRQGELYSAQVHRLRETLEGGDDEDFRKNRFRILSEITRLRQICCDPSLFAEGYEGESGKREALADLLDQAAAGGHKTLVFSQFTSMLDLIALDLKEKGTPFYMLTGATPKEERTRLANAFNRDRVPVFLISLKAGGTGLNLTGADIVVHYDPWWNAAATSQATDRAHRIGQERTVTVYKLICRDTIEEKILRLQEKKRDLAEEILSGESGTFGRMSREDLLALLDGGPN